jgi:glycosyltransferase involved in cell wall biosynthesis
MIVKAFTRYGRSAASTRQRLLQYCQSLSQSGIEIRHHALLDDEYVASLVSGGAYSKLKLVRGYAERMKQLISSDHCDVVWIYGELFPYLPGSLERFAFFKSKPIVYDMDDAFFHQYDDSPSPIVRTLLGGKLKRLLAGSAVCVCGNAYLQAYASRFNANTILIPTVVDTDRYVPSANQSSERPITIGWIGSPSTWALVRPHLALLHQLCGSHAVQIRVVGAGAAAEKDRFPGLQLIEWREDDEVNQVQQMDIGIMPVWDGPFQRGKSGYKLVQYMACGLPVVASPVGVNKDIVLPGETGFLAATDADWKDALVRLICDSELRHRMGQRGRLRAEERYSLRSQAPRMIEAFQVAAASQ